MRAPQELEQIAFREPLTPEEDDRLAEYLARRSAEEPMARKRTADLKQAAFFAARAFDKGFRDSERLEEYVRLLAEAQRPAPNVSFRRKAAEIKSVLSGKSAHEQILRRLARRGEAGRRDLLATEEQLDRIEADLGVTLPASYRLYLRKYAHRRIGTYEPFSAAELSGAAREAWAGRLEPHLLPFLEDNADFFCFDLRSSVAEPPVVFRPHDGTAEETWAGFSAWVDECWLPEAED